MWRYVGNVDKETKNGIWGKFAELVNNGWCMPYTIIFSTRFTKTWNCWRYQSKQDVRAWDQDVTKY